MADGSSDGEEHVGLFQEPDDFYQPERDPTFVQHRMLNGQQLTLRLVGHNPLWGHLLWQAGTVLSTYLEANAVSLVGGKQILELGAGAGLPSLVCALHGAAKVLVTDYPDADLISNLQHNIAHCCSPSPTNITAKGYLWGAPVEDLEVAEGFNVLILADILFNHSEHAKLLSTVQQTMKREEGSQALVFFTPYRPWLLEKDLAFFDLAREGGFEVEKILEKVLEKVMFEEDRGDELLRRTVFGYSLRWSALPARE